MLFCSLLAFLFFYAFWILAIIAVTRGRTSHHKELLDRGFFGSHQAKVILGRADSYVIICQIWAFLTAFFAGIILLKFLELQLHPWIEMKIGVARNYFDNVILVVFSFVLLVITLVFVQTAKAIAFSKPTRSLCAVSPIVVLAGKISWPLVVLLQKISDKIFGWFGLDRPAERELALLPEEITEQVELSAKAGEIEEDEKQMIQSVFTFSDTMVREVMTPRADVISARESSSLEEIVSILLKEKISRILITGNDLDDVKGIIMAKDLVSLVGKPKAGVPLQRFIRPVYFVQGNRHLNELLKEFRREAVHFAVVLDEHGGVDGVVTEEDLLEEIVGEIFDEYDTPLEELDVFKTGSGDLVVDGSMLIDDLNLQHKMNIPKGHYDTLAGFMMHLMGRIPAKGESVLFQGLRLTADETESTRVLKIRIAPAQKPASAT